MQTKEEEEVQRQKVQMLFMHGKLKILNNNNNEELNVYNQINGFFVLYFIFSGWRNGHNR